VQVLSYIDFRARRTPSGTACASDQYIDARDRHIAMPSLSDLAPDDDDPLDAMVLHGSSSYPAAVLPCRALGFVAVRQKEDGEWIENHRVIAARSWDRHTIRAEKISDLSEDTVHEIEQFFVNTAYFTSKKLKLTRWRPRDVARLVARSKR
jgi:inorganic pyrophosphatase